VVRFAAVAAAGFLLANEGWWEGFGTVLIYFIESEGEKAVGWIIRKCHTICNPSRRGNKARGWASVPSNLAELPLAGTEV